MSCEVMMLMEAGASDILCSYRDAPSTVDTSTPINSSMGISARPDGSRSPLSANPETGTIIMESTTIKKTRSVRVLPRWFAGLLTALVRFIDVPSPVPATITG